MLQSFNFHDFLAQQVTIPLEESKDKFIWKHADSGDLVLKEAYQFSIPQYQHLPCAKLIWSPDIPPSKSILVWRLMHEKLPIDEHLMIKGCATPSMCNLCSQHVESSFHILFECPFAVNIWCWFAGCFNMTLQFSAMDDIWKICDRAWSPQCKITITATLVNIINSIWFARNQARFNIKHISWRSCISMIIANTSMSGNGTCKSSSNSIRDFTILKMFKVDIHHTNAPVIKEVIWCPPLFNWTKCNIDGASRGNPGLSSCASVFRNHEADVLCYFVEPLGIASSYSAELCGAMRATELAHQRNYINLWIETDSVLALPLPILLNFVVL
ncbi:hypothetical protein TSUD_28400 [Trifolium subterraneum]|uniref:Reverse transcriptase zinc-binding domain-containing protein n=1 Tax=Trifolium subterraneum TaxID=3900 RepID=A0A2Z6NVM4_TRISU|nr:hypothetical protein TSUD_28400 [Trifolium subterraneum]